MLKILVVGLDYRDLDYVRNAAKSHPDVLFLADTDVRGCDSADTIIELVGMVDGLVFLEDKTGFAVAAKLMDKSIYDREEFEGEKE